MVWEGDGAVHITGRCGGCSAAAYHRVWLGACQADSSRGVSPGSWPSKGQAGERPATSEHRVPDHHAGELVVLGA